MRRRRIVVVAAFVFVLFWMAVSGAIGIAAVESALHPVRRSLGSADEALARDVSTRDRARLDDVSISRDDGAVLRGWSFAPDVSNGNAVILLHGQADNRAGMLGTADMLLRHGYSVLLPDARAHGDSGGQIATYGIKETGDLERWFEWLRASQPLHCIYGLGESMGAAILLQAAAAERRFCAIVAESSFSSFREASYERIGEVFHTGPWLGRTVLCPSVFVAMLYARWRYGVDLQKASPVNAAAASNVPILLIHGLADTNLSPRNSERIKAARASIVLWEPVHAGHCGAASAEPAEFERLVLSWFGEHT